MPLNTVRMMIMMMMTLAVVLGVSRVLVRNWSYETMNGGDKGHAKGGSSVTEHELEEEGTGEGDRPE